MTEIPQRFLQVVHLLVAGEDAAGEQLLALRDDAAYVQMRDSSVAIVINPSKRGAALEAAITEQLSLDKQTHLKLVLIGGGEDVQELLARVQPGLLSRRMVQVFQLAADGTVWGGHKSRVDSPTGLALQAVADGKGPTVSFADLAKLVPEVTAEQRAAARQQHTFVQQFRAQRVPLTLGLLSLLAVVFGLQILWGGSDYIPTLVRMGANTDASLGAEPWRLLASVCLHGGELHFIFNAFVIFILGRELERILGWARMAILLVLAGLGGSLASAMLSEAALSVGASGAFWGVLGAAFALAWRPGDILPPGIVHRMRRAAAINLIINLGASFLPGIDLMAHLGGGVTGAALVLTGVLTRGLAPLGSGDAREPALVRGGAIGCMAALVVSLVVAVVVGRPWVVVQAPALSQQTVGDFTMEIPVPLGEGEAYEVPGGVGRAFGDQLRDPAAIIVEIEPHSPPLSDEEWETRDGWFTRIKTAKPDGGTELEPRRIIEDAAVPTFEERMAFAGGQEQLARYALHRDVRVTVIVLMWTGTRSAWSDVLRRSADSAQPR